MERWDIDPRSVEGLDAFDRYELFCLLSSQKLTPAQARQVLEQKSTDPSYDLTFDNPALEEVRRKYQKFKELTTTNIETRVGETKCPKCGSNKVNFLAQTQAGRAGDEAGKTPCHCTICQHDFYYSG